MDAHNGNEMVLELHLPADLTPLLGAARDELSRESHVRERCFPRWVTDGRMSQTEADDRLTRHRNALAVLDAAVAALEAKAK